MNFLLNNDKEIAPGSSGAGSWQFPMDFLLKLIRKLLPGAPGPPLAISYARDVFSVVRDSRMWCPHNVGRDSWVWGEQETLYTLNSPHRVGEEALSKRSPLSVGCVPRLGGVMVVVVVESYNFFINNYC